MIRTGSLTEPSAAIRAQGTWDAEHGERNRVTVTLATGIPEEVVRAVNLTI